MSSEYIYPPVFAALAREAWIGRSEEDAWLRSLLPNDNLLRALLDISYHASFMREERRGIAFRLGYFSEDYLQRFRESRIANAPRFVPLLAPRPFRSSELMRLAPAVDPTRSMLVIQEGPSEVLHVTGVLDFGRSWWAMRRGEEVERGAFTPPLVFSVTSFEPGNLVISREGYDVLFLRHGQLSQPVFGILAEGPVASFLKEPQQQFYESVCRELGIERFTNDADDRVPNRYYNDFLLGILVRVQELSHGGTILVVRDEISHDDSRLTDRVRVKYASDLARPWDVLRDECVAFKRYYSHHFGIWERANVSQAEFHSDARNLRARGELRDAHDDLMTFIAELTAVDGAVILTDQWRLLGFGAEVIAQSPTLHSVTVARDVALQDTSIVPIDAYGTRHRSAFRFCSSLEDSVAFVVSQDGGVKAIKRVGPYVIVWPDLDVTS